MGFDPETQEWIFVDANDLPAKILKSEQDLINHIKKGFLSHGDFVAMSTEFYSTFDNKDKMAHILKEWNDKINHVRLSSTTLDRVNQETDRFNTNLISLALKNKKMDVIKHLIDDGLDVNQLNALRDGNALLHTAIKNKLDIFNYLLEKGVDVNQENDEGLTPLCLAAEQGSFEMVRDLLDSGASIDLGNNPLINAIESNHPNIVQLLLEKGAVSRINDIDYSLIEAPLHKAIKKENLEIVNLLLESGALIDQLYGRKESTALHLAAEIGNYDVINALLAKGANPNQVDRIGKTALDIAAQHGHDKIVKILSKFIESTPLSHRELISHMKQLGYKYTSDEGTCFGLSSMGLLAILTNEVDLFNERLIRIKKNERLIRIEKTIQNERKQSIEEKKNTEDLDIIAFLDGVELFQNGLKHPFLGDASEMDQFESRHYIAQMVNSIAIEKMQGMYSVDSSVGVYHAEELIQWFEMLKESLTNHMSEPMGLILANRCHAITVGFEPEKQEWIFLNANELPAKILKSEQDLVNHIVNAFNSDGVYIGMCAELYSTIANKDKADTVFREWKNKTNNIRLSATTPERSIHVVDGDDTTLFNLALRFKKTDLIQSIAKNIKNSLIEGNPLLNTLISAGYTEVCKIFIKEGADINKRDKNGLTPLYLAVTEGNLETIKDLLEAGALVDKKIGKAKSIALFKAAAQGSIDAVTLLLDKGSDIKYIDKADVTVLYAAVSSKNIEMVQCLLQRGASMHYGDNPLCCAVRNNDFPMVKFLLENGGISRINHADFLRGESPLYLAVKNGNLKMVNLLLESGVEINKKNGILFPSSTALHLAAENGSLDIINALLAKGASLSQVNKDGKTALMIAERNGHHEAVKILSSFNSIKTPEAPKKEETPRISIRRLF